LFSIKLNKYGQTAENDQKILAIDVTYFKSYSSYTTGVHGFLVQKYISYRKLAELAEFSDIYNYFILGSKGENVIQVTLKCNLYN